jgi:hypothetical protein
MKQKPIKTYKFILIDKHTNEITFANKQSYEQKYSHHRHRAKWFHINSKNLGARQKDSYTASELTFMIVDYYEAQVKEQLRCKRSWDNIKKSVGKLDNLKQYYYDHNLLQLKECREQVKIWKKKKADLIASPEYMFELLRK